MELRSLDQNIRFSIFRAQVCVLLLPLKQFKQTLITLFHSLTIFNVSAAAPADCPDFAEQYSKAIDGLNLMVDIKRKVIEDVVAIRDKFPCIERVLDFVKGFVSNIK